MKKLLAAVDFSEETDKVLEYARKLMDQFQAELLIVHCESIDYYISMNEFDDIPQPSILENRKEIINRRLEELKTLLKQKGMKAECALLEGPTVSNILSEAEKFKADLILVGSHKHGTFYNLLFGSTHDALIKHSKVPVLVVPPIVF